MSGTGLHLKAQNASIAIAVLFECVIWAKEVMLLKRSGPWTSVFTIVCVFMCNSTRYSLFFIADQPGQNCTGDPEGIGETSPWAHDLAGLHPDTGHLSEQRSEENSFIKKLLNRWQKGKCSSDSDFFCCCFSSSFQSFSYQTRQTSSMLCLQQPTLTLFCATSTKARRNHWEQLLVLDDSQSRNFNVQILWLQNELSSAVLLHNGLYF